MDVSVTIQTQVPAGTSLPFRGSEVPYGYLLEDAGYLDPLTYPRLFSVIGYTYGQSGDLFRLPDSRGRVDIGSGQGTGLTERLLGNKGGAETHILSESEMPSHTHIQNPHDHTQATHSHSFTGRTVSLRTGTDVLVEDVLRADSGSRGTNSIAPVINYGTATNQNTGGGAAHNNMQPFIVATRMIKY